MPEHLEKFADLFEKILELWGEEFFEYLQERASETDTILDDIIVEKLKDILLD
jgi:hypothetical protein